MTLDVPKDTDRTGGIKGFGFKVVLWNCSCHDFEGVAQALVQAIRCSLEKGHTLAQSVHNNGKAIVFSGHKERCELVAEILKDHGLRTTLEE